MRIAVLEAVSAGLCGPDPEPSLQREGWAMWQAVVTDLLAIPEFEVDTLLQDRLLDPLPARERLHVWRIEDPAETVLCWSAAVAEAAATLIIAPESEGCLQQLLAALPSHVSSWNCSAAATELCSDKLALAEFLTAAGVATIPTVRETWTAVPNEFPSVVKPQDGCGSFLVRRCDNLATWKRCHREFQACGNIAAIRQPFSNGRTLSRAGWFHPQGVDWLPVAEQRLSEEGQFRYLGGAVPARLTTAERLAIDELCPRLAAAIPGLRGYVGIDLLLPDITSATPLVVEINPRLTTSYVGYRAWLAGSPWQSWQRGSPARRITPDAAHVIRFSADGQLDRT